ncbi:MAG TPA: hypothetical protein PJ982_19400, partial [Lacipirellulaceae bacterium]|nr:hypothetical protein [Lacipirellulaceae bacterium]
GSIPARGGETQNNNITRTSPSARLRLQGSITQSATGRLIADGNIVDYLLGGITGGTLEALNGGSFLFAVDGTIGSLVNNAPMNLVAGTTGIDLFVAGSGLTNNGVITINATNLPGGTGITFQTTQLLAGSGEIVLNRSDTGGTGGAAFVTAIGAVVTQAAGHTIRGEGTISAELVNLGLVEAMDANGDGQAVLRIRNNFTGSANATNANIFRAAAGSMIDLNGRLDQTAAGRLIAADGGEIQLRAATLRGGSLETAGTGVVRLENTSTVENIVNKGVLNIPGGGSEKLLNVAGTSLPNPGVVTVNSTASGTGRIIATSSLNLAGAGEIVLGGAVTASSLTVNAGLTVTQGPDHT